MPEKYDPADPKKLLISLLVVILPKYESPTVLDTRLIREKLKIIRKTTPAILFKIKESHSSIPLIYLNCC